MLDRDIIQGRGFRNVVEDGRVTPAQRGQQRPGTVDIVGGE